MAVGAMKSGPEAILCEDYRQRAVRQGRGIGIANVEEREVSESRRQRAAERTREEAGRVRAQLPGNASTVLLSARGTRRDSAAFAGLLRDSIDRGTSDLAFLIGGPDGHDREFEAQNPCTLSLGDMTWPHRLVRAMLCEQIYRAVTILTNHPYHRA